MKVHPFEILNVLIENFNCLFVLDEFLPTQLEPYYTYFFYNINMQANIVFLGYD